MLHTHVPAEGRQAGRHLARVDEHGLRLAVLENVLRRVNAEGVVHGHARVGHATARLHGQGPFRGVGTVNAHLGPRCEPALRTGGANGLDNGVSLGVGDPRVGRSVRGAATEVGRVLVEAAGARETLPKGRDRVRREVGRIALGVRLIVGVASRTVGAR